MKFGIVGSGTMAEIYASLLKQRNDAKLVAVTGNTEEKLTKFRESFHCKTYSKGDVSEMIRENPGLDAIILAAPETVRLEPLEKIVGKVPHLLLEKPFATSWEEAKSLSKLLEALQGTLALCHVLRHSPRFFAAKSKLLSGDIGEVKQFVARRNSNSKRVQRVLGKFDLTSWLTPHDVDLMRWFSGAEVESVFASSIQDGNSEIDNILALLKFSTGANGILENSWCTPPLSGKAAEAQFEIRGTKGKIEICDSEMNVNVFSSHAKVETPDTYEDFLVDGIRGGFFAHLLESFVRSVNNKKNDNTAVIQDGLETTRVSAMIRLSLNEGRQVHRNEFK